MWWFHQLRSMVSDGSCCKTKARASELIGLEITDINCHVSNKDCISFTAKICKAVENRTQVRREGQSRQLK